MKKILFISSILFLSVGLVNAQATETKAQPVLKPAQIQQQPANRAKARVAEISKICSLKPEQETRLTALYVDYFTKSEELKAKKGTLSAEEFGTQTKALKSERDAALKSTLTTDQITKLKAAKEEMSKDGAAKPRQ